MDTWYRADYIAGDAQASLSEEHVGMQEPLLILWTTPLSGSFTMCFKLFMLYRHWTTLINLPFRSAATLPHSKTPVTIRW